MIKAGKHNGGENIVKKQKEKMNAEIGKRNRREAEDR